MIVVHNFLLENNEATQYALVTYNGKTEAMHFVRHTYEGKPWFLESPCGLCIEYEFSENENIEEWCLSVADELLEPDVDRKEYYEKYMKPLIVDNVLYDIYCPQVDPYLPKEVDEIHKASAGIPRMINRICEKALMYAFQQQRRLVDDYMIKFVVEHEMLTVTTK